VGRALYEVNTGFSSKRTWLFPLEDHYHITVRHRLGQERRKESLQLERRGMGSWETWNSGKFRARNKIRKDTENNALPK
jgi:hypothetical protein